MNSCFELGGWGLGGLVPLTGSVFWENEFLFGSSIAPCELPPNVVVSNNNLLSFLTV